MYTVRCIDDEGVVWTEFKISEFRRILEVAIIPKLQCIKVEESMPEIVPTIQTIQFEFEQQVGINTLIYRRKTPLWKY